MRRKTPVTADLRCHVFARGVAAVLSLAMLLSGCVLMRSSAFATDTLSPSQRHVHLQNEFGMTTTHSIAYRAPWDYEEYEAYRGNGRAEVLFAVANGPQTSLVFPAYRLHHLTRSWLYNHGASLRWGETHYLQTRSRSYTYALYRRVGPKGDARACVAFLSTWDTVLDDPQHRPRQALFGYYCAPAGQHLTRGRTRVLLRGIRTDISHLRQVYYGQHLSNDPEARRIAAGQGADATFGNIKFPFQFATHYTVDGKSRLVQ